MNARVWLGVALAASVAGCDRRSAAPSPVATSTASSAPVVAPPSSSAPSPASSAPMPFGPWVRCYGGFRPTSSPVRDVQRLAMLCGPSLGMHAAWPIAEGEVDERGPPREHPLVLAKGECARVFAVASESVRDLDVEIVGPTGAVRIEDAIDDRWPVVPSDRAECVTEAGTYVVKVRARKGKGGYAVQAWVLP